MQIKPYLIKRDNLHTFLAQNKQTNIACSRVQNSFLDVLEPVFLLSTNPIKTCNRPETKNISTIALFSIFIMNF